MYHQYANQTGEEDNSNSSWWCTETAKALAQSIGTVGSALISSKSGKKNNSPAPPPVAVPPPPKSKFTAKNIAIGSVIAVAVIGAIAGGIWVFKGRYTK